MSSHDFEGLKSLASHAFGASSGRKTDLSGGHGGAETGYPLAGGGISIPRLNRRAFLLSTTLAGLISGGGASSVPPEPVRYALGAAELLVFPDPSAPALALAASVRLAPADEGHDEGVGSLLARLLGADAEGRSTAQIQRDIDAFGAIGSEYDGAALTAWALTDPSALEDAARTLLVNVLAHPVFSAESVALGLADLERARLRSESDLVDRTLDALRTRVLGTSTNLLGTPQSVARLTAERVEAFHSRFVRPDRTTLIAAGKCDPEAVRDKVTALLAASGWSELEPSPKPKNADIWEPLDALRDLALPLRAPSLVVAGGLRLPGLRQTAADYPALLLLDALLGGGKGGRLFTRLRDRASLGYDTHSVFLPGRDATLWGAYLWGDTPTDTTRAALRAFFSDCGKGDFTESELTRAKGWWRGQRLRERQRLLSRARSAASLSALGLDPARDAALPAQLDAVTLEEVNALARKLFAQNPAFVYTLPE